VVLLSGEGGIGKSRLVHTLKDLVADEPHVRWECRSVPYYQNTALYPLTELFQRLLQWQPDETPDEKLGKLEAALSQYTLPLEEAVPLLAPFLALSVPEHRYPPLTLSPQRQRQKTLETIVAILLELAARQPVLFIVEDLHWTDPTTLEWLHLLIDQTPTAPLLVLLTCRPHFQPAWPHRSYVTAMTLHHLSHAHVAQMVAGMTDGKTLPHEVLTQVVEKTDGVPLFIEELTKAILESGHLQETEGHYELVGAFRALTIPSTLQDSLMARLDRLRTGKVIAQLGATIGRQFSYALLQAVAQHNERTLHEELQRLVEAELLSQRGVPPQATYVFKHALIQDAAYESLLRSTRQQYHQRIAQVLEAQFPETAEAEPELLAHHYTEAGLAEPAIGYWQRAGQRSTAQSAYVEAVAYLTQGLEVLATLADSPERARHELILQITLGPALMATKGYGAPEVERAYSRACALCQQGGDTPHHFAALHGLWLFSLVRGVFQRARVLGEQLLSLAQHQHHPVLLLEAHRALATTCFYLGELGLTRTHAAQSHRLYDRQQHRTLTWLYSFDVGVACLVWDAHALWLLGFPDQALWRSHEAFTLAQELAHSLSLGLARQCAAVVSQLRGEVQIAQEQAQALVKLCTEQGFPTWLAGGMILRGAALAAQGQRDEPIGQIRKSLATYRATGAVIWCPYFLALLAEASWRAGQAEAGLTALAEALATVHATGERWWEAELHRLRGEFLRAQAGTRDEAHGTRHMVQEAEASLHQALAVARHQEAKSLELRAAMSLSRLWQHQGKRTEAYELLAPIYGWFTEGFDTADLQEARALLEELAR
jgi:predicted ATPase